VTRQEKSPGMTLISVAGVDHLPESIIIHLVLLPKKVDLINR
jgi:hypothetical protein